MICAGPERKSAVINEMNKKIVAYHEGGHALVAYYTPGDLLNNNDNNNHDINNNVDDSNECWRLVTCIKTQLLQWVCAGFISNIVIHKKNCHYAMFNAFIINLNDCSALAAWLDDGNNIYCGDDNDGGYVSDDDSSLIWWWSWRWSW